MTNLTDIPSDKDPIKVLQDRDWRMNNAITILGAIAITLAISLLLSIITCKVMVDNNKVLTNQHEQDLVIIQQMKSDALLLQGAIDSEIGEKTVKLKKHK